MFYSAKMPVEGVGCRYANYYVQDSLVLYYALETRHGSIEEFVQSWPANTAQWSTCTGTGSDVHLRDGR